MSDVAIREALDKAEKVIAENPEKAKARNVATASRAGGLKFSIVGPNGERLETDMPKGVGGQASAPSPGWALRASLAACTGTVIAMRAAKLGIALDRLNVMVESGADQRGMLGLDDKVSPALSGFRTRVAIRASGAERATLEELVRWADAHSPVACTMRQALSAPIEVVVE
jgi:uncharacterized OsmC-like protein